MTPNAFLIRLEYDGHFQGYLGKNDQVADGNKKPLVFKDRDEAEAEIERLENDIVFEARLEGTWV